ncbi:hypothetical protein KCU99_g261, partial [Aureobasidium melanogenum]
MVSTLLTGTAVVSHPTRIFRRHTAEKLNLSSTLGSLHGEVIQQSFDSTAIVVVRLTGRRAGVIGQRLESAEGSESSGVMVEPMICQASVMGDGLRLRSPRPSAGETGRWAKLRGCGDDCEVRKRTIRDEATGSDVSSGGDGRLEETPLRSRLVASVVDLSRIVVVTSCRRRGSMPSQGNGRWRDYGEGPRAQVVVGSRDRSWSDAMHEDDEWASEIGRTVADKDACCPKTRIGELIKRHERASKWEARPSASPSLSLEIRFLAAHLRKTHDD